MRHTKKGTDEAIGSLRELLRPGDTIHCYVNHVSRSGMSRVIVPMVLGVANRSNAEGRLQAVATVRHIGYLVAKALQWQDDGDQGVKVQGCGMDMVFHMTETLGAVLFGRDARGIGRLRSEKI